MAFRSAIPDFQLGNPLYVGARVTFYVADVNGEKTATPATLYAEPVGPQTAVNPQTLDSEGKLAAPLYIEVPVVGEVVFQNNESHDTGVILPLGRWKGDWVTATIFVTSDIVREPGTGSDRKFYLVTQLYQSGASIAADIAAGNLELLFDPTPLIQGAELAQNSAQGAAAAAMGLVRRAARQVEMRAQSALTAAASYGAQAAKTVRQAKELVALAEGARSGAAAFMAKAAQMFRRAKAQADRAEATADTVQITVGGHAGAAASHAKRARVSADDAAVSAASLTDDQIVLRSQVYG